MNRMTNTSLQQWAQAEPLRGTAMHMYLAVLGGILGDTVRVIVLYWVTAIRNHTYI